MQATISLAIICPCVFQTSHKEGPSTSMTCMHLLLSSLYPNLL